MYSHRPVKNICVLMHLREFVHRWYVNAMGYVTIPTAERKAICWAMCILYENFCDMLAWAVRAENKHARITLWTYSGCVRIWKHSPIFASVSDCQHKDGSVSVANKMILILISNMKASRLLWQNASWMQGWFLEFIGRRLNKGLLQVLAAKWYPSASI